MRASLRSSISLLSTRAKTWLFAARPSRLRRIVFIPALSLSASSAASFETMPMAPFVAATLARSSRSEGSVWTSPPQGASASAPKRRLAARAPAGVAGETASGRRSLSSASILDQLMYSSV